MSSNPATHLLNDGTLGERSFASRAAELSQPERAVYRRILQHVIASTEPPLDVLTAGQIAPLIEADLIQTGDDDRLRVASPFSAPPTRHRVTLQDGRFDGPRDRLDKALAEAAGRLTKYGEPPNVKALRAMRADLQALVDRLDRRVYAAVKFFLYTMAGSAFLLVAILFLYFRAGSQLGHPSFALGDLERLSLSAAAGRWLFGDLLDSLDDAEAR